MKRLAFAALLAFAAAAARADDAGRLLRFADQVAAELDRGGAGLNLRLQDLYRGILDLPALAARVAPAPVWAAAGPADRKRFQALLLCRIALETERKGAEAGEWTLVGERAEGDARLVALRLKLAGGGQRTAIFELVGPPDAARVRDLRSEDGRLSQRLAEAILRDAGPPAMGEEAGDWIRSLACR